MKKLFFILTLFLSSFSLFAQPCGEKLDCPPGIKYPYQFCIDGKLGDYICTDDPNNYKDPSSKYHCVPIKAKLPIEVEYVSDSGTTTGVEYFNKYRDESGREVNLFGLDWWEEPIGNQSSFVYAREVIEACDKWNCVCGVDTSLIAAYNYGTMLRMSFSDDWRNFGDTPEEASGTPGVAKMRAISKASEGYTDCYMNYDSAIIYFNSSPEFLYGPGTNKFPTNKYTPIKKGWASQVYVYNADIVPRAVSVFSFMQVALHEIGHMLGLGHYNERDIGQFCDNPDSLSGVMDYGVADVRQPAGNKINLSEDDKCMFAKLYCPELSGVGIYEIPPNPNILIAPNPITDEINISFEISDGVKNVSIQIYSEEGKILGTLMSEKMYSEGIHIYNTKLNLQSGAYFILTKIENINHFNKIIIE